MPNSFYTYYHHHLVVPSARISLTLSRHSSLSFIASGRSSGLHPVSSQSYCMQVRAGRPAFARPCDGIHWRTSPMSSSLLLQQCPTCLVRLTLIVFVMGGWWPSSCCFVGVASRTCSKLFAALQFYFKQVHILVLFNHKIGPYQVLPLRARVDLGAMEMKGYSAFPKVPTLLEPNHQIVWCHNRTLVGRV